MRHLIPLSLFLIFACASDTPRAELIENNKTLIEISDLYQTGHEQLELALNEYPGLGDILDSNLSRIPLIALTIEYDDGERERIQQSGVFVADGRYILTAGHGFYVDDGRLVDLKAHTMLGHELKLNVVALKNVKHGQIKEDWAILQPMVPYMLGGIGSSSSSFPGKDAIILGFPGGMALNDTGQVVHALEVDHGPVYPLAIICDRLVTRPHILKPRVGAIPIRGMSGAPVLNVKGELIGLFSSVSRTRNISGWQYIFNMSELPTKQLDSLMAK